MRISATKICQLIEAEPPFLVVKDEITTSEAKFYKADLERLAKGGTYTDWENPKGRVEVVITADELPYLAKAIEYFTPYL
jgi:hypothetical protein